MNFFNRLFMGRAAGNAQKIIVPEKPKLYRIINYFYQQDEAGISIGKANLPPDVGYILQHHRLTYTGTLDNNFSIKPAERGKIEAVFQEGCGGSTLATIVEDGRIYTIIGDFMAEDSKKSLDILLQNLKENNGFDAFYKKEFSRRHLQEAAEFKFKMGPFSYNYLEILSEPITTS